MSTKTARFTLSLLNLYVCLRFCIPCAFLCKRVFVCTAAAAVAYNKVARLLYFKYVLVNEYIVCISQVRSIVFTTADISLYLYRE